MKTKHLHNGLFKVDNKILSCRIGTPPREYTVGRRVNLQVWARIKTLYNGRECELVDASTGDTYNGIVEGQRRTETSFKTVVTTFNIRLTSGEFSKNGTGDKAMTW